MKCKNYFCHFFRNGVYSLEDVEYEITLEGRCNWCLYISSMNQLKDRIITYDEYAKPHSA